MAATNIIPTPPTTTDDLKGLILTQTERIDNLALEVRKLTSTVQQMKKTDSIEDQTYVKEIQTASPSEDVHRSTSSAVTRPLDVPGGVMQITEGIPSDGGEQSHRSDSSSSENEESQESDSSLSDATATDDEDDESGQLIVSAFGDEMPEKDSNKIKKNFEFITDEVKQPDELCQKLLEKSVFVEYIAEVILADYDERQTELCDKLLTKLIRCRGSYDLFLYCLKELGYTEAIKLLETDVFGFLKPGYDSDSENTDKELERRINDVLKNAEKRIKSGLNGKQKGMSEHNSSQITLNMILRARIIKEPGKLSSKLYEKRVFSKKTKRKLEALETKNKKKTTKVILNNLLESGDCYEQFLSALQEIGCNHIVNKLENIDTRDDYTKRRKGKLRGKMPKENLVKIQRNFTFVRDNIKDPIALGSKLVKNSVFDEEDQNKLMKIFQNGKRETCRALIDMLFDCNGCYDRFILCLRQLGHDDIVRELEKNSTDAGEKETSEDLEARIESIVKQAKKRIENGRQGKERGRMPEEDKIKIQRNLPFLKENLREPGMLSDKLFESFVFDKEDKETVKDSEIKGIRETTSRLLEILEFSGDCYPKFLMSLHDLGYYDVIDKLEARERAESQTNKTTDIQKERKKSKEQEEEEQKKSKEQEEQEEKMIRDVLASTKEEECSKRVQKLLQETTDTKILWRLFAYDYNTETCLMKVVQNGWNEVFDYLLKSAGDVNRLNQNQENLLLVLLKCNDAIQYGTHSQPYKDMAKLMLKYVNLLVQRGIDTQVKDSKGNTPFLLAARSGLSVVVAFLVESGGVSPYDVNDDRENVLHCLFKFSSINYESIALLVKMKKHLKALDKADNRGRTPLHIICNLFKTHPMLEAGIIHDEDEYEYRNQAITMLLDVGWNMDKQDEKGMTPLMYLVRSVVENEQGLEIVTLLLDRGADTSLENKDGETVFNVAQKYKKMSIIEFLKRYSV